METIEVPEAGSRDYLSQRSIFLFDADSAKRLAIVRMHYGMTQAELAKKIGCSQNTISDIERSVIHFSEKVTLWNVQVALGSAWRFVVFGKKASSYNEKEIALKYWREKFKKIGRKKANKGVLGYGRAFKGEKES